MKFVKNDTRISLIGINVKMYNFLGCIEENGSKKKKFKFVFFFLEKVYRNKNVLFWIGKQYSEIRLF